MGVRDGSAPKFPQLTLQARRFSSLYDLFLRRAGMTNGNATPPHATTEMAMVASRPKRGGGLVQLLRDNSQLIGCCGPPLHPVHTPCVDVLLTLTHQVELWGEGCGYHGGGVWLRQRADGNALLLWTATSLY